MKNYIVADDWKIIEDRFDSHLHMNSESLFSIGNGRMGQRANFEETYSGPSLKGSYLAGIYYPDKTRVGWWKNGYPEYFAKVLNSVNWIGLKVVIDREEIDLFKVNIQSFYRELDMQNGLLKRAVSFELSDNRLVDIESERFYSIVDKDLCFQRYRVTLLNFSAKVEITYSLDTNVRNSDANYDDDFWRDRSEESRKKYAWVKSSTKKTDFVVCAAMSHSITGEAYKIKDQHHFREDGKAGHKVCSKISKGGYVELNKYVAIVSSLYYENDILVERARSFCQGAKKTGYSEARKAQKKAWRTIWKNCDIEVKGDVSAQQGIRFNIFQMLQTYTGDDPRLNIGPKGFTGEKYGGSTYWDTEAYCLPFYMSTTAQDVGRNLLIYRYKHLPKAIENAQKLGFDNGAALYPMVTMNGEECHNEWEITFEEIHRNGAIAYAIHDYIRYTGDQAYLADYGLEVLISIARFWAQRVHVSPAKKLYVMHGVTGPNEYENNVNNNWYTNYFATWCLKYAIEAAEYVKREAPEKYQAIVTKLSLDEGREFSHWTDIAEEMYFPTDESKGIFLQQDGYQDKEDLNVADLDPAILPLNQNWSWDRILRSPFIKQADVLQGMYFFEDHFGEETISRNFDYYEPRTVHESSLSPCVHSILAAMLGREEKAYEMYLRTARLDLDNYNNDTEDGCHITSMAGTWLAVVKGFAGMRVRNNLLSFKPFIPKAWEAYSFRLRFRGYVLQITIGQDFVEVENFAERSINIKIGEAHVTLPARESKRMPY